jgi:hypothetical protein
MAATPISASTRYIPPGTRAVYYLPSASDYTSPTRAELDAGTDLTGEISAISGFAVSSNTVDVQDLSSRFTAQIAGLITAPSSSLTFYSSDDSTDVRELLPRDTTGYIVMLWEGDTAGHRMDIFPVTVTSTPKSSGITDPATIEVQFAITAVPEENVTVPA